MTTKPPIHPNTVTAARLPLAPIAVACMVTDTAEGYLAAFVLGLLLEVTDVADGWLARRYGVVTTFGKLFDPFSDAFSRFTMFLGFMAIGVADLWMIMLIFARDATISFIRSVAAVRQVVVAARFSGKLKAVVQGIGTGLILLSLLLGSTLEAPVFPEELPWYTMLVITVVTFGSFVDYIIGNLAILRAAWNDEAH